MESYSDKKIVNYFWLGMLFFGLGSIIMWYVAMKRIYKQGNYKFLYIFVLSLLYFLIIINIATNSELIAVLQILGLLFLISAYLSPIIKLSILPNNESGKFRI